MPVQARVGLLEAVRAPELLGATLEPWPAQERLLTSLEQGDISLHVWSIGRQSGKSTLAAAFAVWNAALRPDLDAVLPRGRKRYVLVACPGEAQSREFISVAGALIESSPVLSSWAQVRDTTITFRLPSGAVSVIRALPANARSVRGMSASALVLDELAHFQLDTNGQSTDTRMFDALSPSLRAFGAAARTLAISTPFGRSNLFFDLFSRAEAGALAGARAVHAPTWEVVPGFDHGWLEGERARRGEDFVSQEYGASFVEGVGSFFDLRGVEFAEGPARPEDCSRWVAGLDPAFHGDKFGVALVGVSREEPGVLLVGRVEGIEPRGAARSFSSRRAREDRTLSDVLEVLEPYQPRQLVTDQHQADAVRSFFGREGFGMRVVNLTAPLQTASFTSTRARIVDGSLRVWRHPALLEELRRVRAAQGSERIELPRFGGSHCDIASALALAAYELRSAQAGGVRRGRSGGGTVAAAVAVGGV